MSASLWIRPGCPFDLCFFPNDRLRFNFRQGRSSPPVAAPGSCLPALALSVVSRTSCCCAVSTKLICSTSLTMMCPLVQPACWHACCQAQVLDLQAYGSTWFTVYAISLHSHAASLQLCKPLSHARQETGNGTRMQCPPHTGRPTNRPPLAREVHFMIALCTESVSTKSQRLLQMHPGP